MRVAFKTVALAALMASVSERFGALIIEGCFTVFLLLLFF